MLRFICSIRTRSEPWNEFRTEHRCWGGFTGLVLVGSGGSAAGSFPGGAPNHLPSCRFMAAAAGYLAPSDGHDGG